MPSPEFTRATIIDKLTPENGLVAEVLYEAGDAHKFTDHLLAESPNNHNQSTKQDSILAAMYLMGDFSEGLTLDMLRIVPPTQALRDQSLTFLDTALYNSAESGPILSREVITEAIIAAVWNGVEPLVGSVFLTGLEFRITANDESYVALLVPRQFRLAPQRLSERVLRELRDSRAQDRPPLIAEGYENFCFVSNVASVARGLATDALYNFRVDQKAAGQQVL